MHRLPYNYIDESKNIYTYIRFNNQLYNAQASFFYLQDSMKTISLKQKIPTEYIYCTLLKLTHIHSSYYLLKYIQCCIAKYNIFY